MKKTLATISLSGALFAMSMSGVFAADCTVTTTGPFSGNNCKTTVKKFFTQNQNNLANIAKKQDSSTTTGNNTADTNTMYTGGIMSSAAHSWTKAQTDANSTMLVLDQTAGSAPTGGKIDISGPFSTNVVENKSIKKASVSINNNANVDVDQKSSANTGFNSISLNTVASGGINSGPATSGSKSETVVNWTNISITQ